MRVLWLTFIPSPYRLRFFEELSKSCDLTVLFECSSSKNRGNNWNQFKFDGYQGLVLPGVTVGGFDRFCPSVVKYLNRSFDVIVISNPTSPTGIFAASVLRLKKIPYIVETDGAFPSTNPSGIKHWLKKFVIKPAMLCLSTADQNDKYFLQCGAKQSALRRYPFTSLSQKDIDNALLPNKTEKAQLRKKLGMDEEKIVLSVGRFSYDNGYGKGYDVLLQTAQILKSIGFYIVGDDPTEEFLQMQREMRLDNVHFVGFKAKEALAEYYAAADVFVLLTRGDVWGLVVNEAMMFGLPVITTNKCNAGLEMVIEDENGFIVEGEDAAEVAKCISTIMDDAERQEKFSQRSRKVAEQYTIEKMAEEHAQIFGGGYKP